MLRARSARKTAAPFQHAYQQNALARKVVAYLCAERRHPGSDLLAAEQHVVLVLSHWLCHSSMDPGEEKAPGQSVFANGVKRGRLYTLSRDLRKRFIMNRRVHVSLYSHRTLLHRHIRPLPLAGFRLWHAGLSIAIFDVSASTRTLSLLRPTRRWAAWSGPNSGTCWRILRCSCTSPPSPL